MRRLRMMLLLLIVAAGLASYPTRNLGPELQQNGGFESGLEGWDAPAYTLDTAVAHSGRAALRLTDSNRIPYAQSVSQLLPGRRGPGFYRVTAFIKTQDLGANGRGKGVRIGLKAKEETGEANCARGCGFSKVYSGTSDWFRVDLESVYLRDPSPGILVTSEAYGSPSGTLWLDDVVVQEERPPALEVVMRVPNYRGILWSDQPSIAEFEVTQYEAGPMSAVAADNAGHSQTFPVQPGLATLDLSALRGSSITVSWRVGDTVAFPDFRLERKAAAERSELTATISPEGRFLIRGKPTFLLGVYDSGLGYTSTQAAWESSFATSRRLFELPGLNGYINYWFGTAGRSSMLSMMDALHAHGILYWQTANCFKAAFKTTTFPSLAADPAYANSLGKHPGLGGWYLADECVPGLADEVFNANALLQDRDPDGVNVGILNSDVRPWLPSMDIVGVDKYPLYGAEPASGYPLGSVYESAAEVRKAVGDKHPFWQVIQFFKFTSKGRWPTREELRSMSYAAIVGGADGLFYWSLGANALAHVCTPSTAWCPERVDYFERLKAVFAELSGFAALANADVPASVVAVSDSAIKVRVKQGSGNVRLYVVAYNHSPERRTTRLDITNDSGTGLLTSFNASFGPWGAQVFEVGSDYVTPRSVP